MEITNNTKEKTDYTQGHTVIVNQPKNNSNGLGTAGFVLALLGLFLGWIPLFGWLLWLLGFLLSIVGLFKKPRGLAIAGTIISLIGIIILVFIFGIAILGASLQ